MEMASKGLTIVDAIHEKYDDVETTIFIHVPASAPGKKDSGEITIPPILSLQDCHICEAGNVQKLQSLCGKVRELDLTKNNISDWDQVIQIIESIPCLSFLNLTSNKLQNKLSWELDKQFPNITHLILNDTGVSWEMIVQLLQIFPNVAELHLSLNNYTSVDLPSDFKYPNVTKLYLNGNRITSWGMICQLGLCFPKLENFILIDSSIPDLNCDIDIEEAFPCLKSLNISNSNLSSWEDIEALRDFPELYDVRLQDIPFLGELPEKERRQNIIARLPNITKLNGSPVHDQEREEAERTYIRQFLDADVKPKRFYELEKIHGKLQHLAEVDLSPDLYLHMKVKFEDKVEVLDILKDQTVKELKKTLQNFCGLPVSRIKLYEYRTDYKHFNQITSSLRSLHSFRFTELDELHIFDKNETGALDARVCFS